MAANPRATTEQAVRAAELGAAVSAGSATSVGAAGSPAGAAGFSEVSSLAAASRSSKKEGGVGGGSTAASVLPLLQVQGLVVIPVTALHLNSSISSLQVLEQLASCSPQNLAKGSSYM